MVAARTSERQDSGASRLAATKHEAAVVRTLARRRSAGSVDDGRCTRTGDMLERDFRIQVREAHPPQGATQVATTLAGRNSAVGG